MTTSRLRTLPSHRLRHIGRRAIVTANEYGRGAPARRRLAVACAMELQRRRAHTEGTLTMIDSLAPKEYPLHLAYGVRVG